MNRRHQWIFITDTVDAVYPPETFLPEALLDQLAEIVSDLPVTEMKVRLLAQISCSDLTHRCIDWVERWGRTIDSLQRDNLRPVFNQPQHATAPAEVHQAD